MGGSSSRLGQSSHKEERRGRMPLDYIHSQPAPIHSGNSQPRNATNSSVHDHPDYAKIGQQHPTSFRYPTSPVLVESLARTNSAVDHRQSASSFHPIPFSQYIPDPHQPNPSPHPPEIYPPPDAVATSPSRHIKCFVSINFGAAYSGVSYAASNSREVHQILAWPGSSASVSKIPTCLVYDDLGHIRAWGVETKDMSLKKGWVRCEWFKLWLDPISASRAIGASRFLQPPKNVVDVVADYLSCIWMHTKNQINRENGLCSLRNAEVYLTVPSSWDLHASLLLREAATKAGLVQKSDSEDIYWQERLHIIPETEASVIHSVLSRTFKFQRDHTLTICDAGGATVDLATYNVLCALGTPKIAEAVPRSGSYCGSLFLDLRFRELVHSRLATHPVHLDEASLAHFVRSFSESTKLAYKGPEDDSKLFRFRCLRVEDLHDPAVGLDQGEVVISGDVLRREVFDPVIKQVLRAIASHVQASNGRLDVLLLVGGFSANEYLVQRITDQFASTIVSVIRPPHADIPSCWGGAPFGVGPLVSSVIPPQNVFRRVTLLAEGEDRTLRPAYIMSGADRSLCENRVEYIVRRGTSVMKGSRCELRLRKHCSSRSGRTFELVLHTSDGDQTRRYFDQEQGKELYCCVDLGTYPSFQTQAEASPFGNFYVDFVLGFEMDSAEIRCVLLYEGAKCGSVTCHTRNNRPTP